MLGSVSPTGLFSWSSTAAEIDPNSAFNNLRMWVKRTHRLSPSKLAKDYGGGRRPGWMGTDTFRMWG